MAKHRIGDVVILLPGILGSVLACDGKEVWAPSPGAAMRAVLSLGRSVKDLELRADPWDVDDLGDGVEATRLVNDVHIIPGLWGIDGYTSISRFITDHFDVERGRTYFEFPYDWRRDNRVAARKLRAFADEKLHAARATNPDAKLVLIGHSMGGLVARYFLECLDGWRDTRTLVTFGTPYRGSLNALDFLANGFVKKIGPLKVVDLSQLLHSLTSVYQLLPIYPCVDVGSGYRRVAELAPEVIADLDLDIDLDRAGSALRDFHRAIEAGVAAHDPRPYAIHSVVGIAQGTLQSARIADGRFVVEQHYDGEDMGGDGTVPRVSSTPIETDDMQPAYQPMYSGDRHASLQNADPVQTQLLGILTARPLQGFKEVRGLRLEADEILAADEPLDVRVLPDRGNLDLAATVVSLATGHDVGEPRPLRRDADDVHHLTVEPLPPGDYRLTVRGAGTSAELIDPVHGLFCVVGDGVDG
jgi:pimeloyl-ACP methyl ester carboxylesterase